MKLFYDTQKRFDFRRTFAKNGVLESDSHTKAQQANDFKLRNTKSTGTNNGPQEAAKGCMERSVKAVEEGCMAVEILQAVNEL